MKIPMPEKPLLVTPNEMQQRLNDIINAGSWHFWSLDEPVMEALRKQEYIGFKMSGFIVCNRKVEGSTIDPVPEKPEFREQYLDDDGAWKDVPNRFQDILDADKEKA